MGNPIFLPIILPFSTFPSIDQFLDRSLLAFCKFPVSNNFLINVEDTVFLFFINGFGLTNLYSNLSWNFLSSLTSPSRLWPNLKLLLTNRIFDFNFLFK